MLTYHISHEKKFPTALSVPGRSGVKIAVENIHWQSLGDQFLRYSLQLYTLQLIFRIVVYYAI